ncbi:mitochondrial inner membrane protease subunit 1-like [Dendronephthya gigantea]|uniref:mitochondrial inner membrane protease subunit 1-like n=1 Tax=Dendronephthya gigantea TaxID=151771 RepID=UPI00106CB649|nr:mitochondrial inner membrane protease subunit 1-like [Dendronephthya gigantea]
MIERVLTKLLYTVGQIGHFGCVLYVIKNYVVEPTLCFGTSMQPTINSSSKNDVVLTEHLSSLHNLKKNDIVIVRSPKEPDSTICKRITGLEGDMVETYVSDSSEYKKIQVPKGHVWLTGDNTNNSVDSRTYGPVPCGLILGRVCYKLYPISEFGPLT